MTLSPGPPPWPIPPSWTITTPSAAAGPPPAAEPVTPPSGPPHRTVALLAPDDAGARDVLGAVPGVRVDARSIPAPAPGFPGVRELADAAARALSEGADGVVIVAGTEAPDETAWALDLLHPGDAPLVLAANPDHTTDVADAISVAAAAPYRAGCLLVTRGEIHAARHVRRIGTDAPVLASPGAGPLGHVTAGVVRLAWRPPERLTLRGGTNGGPNGGTNGGPGSGLGGEPGGGLESGRSPRVGLHTVTLGDDGELLGVLAERCDGLIVTATATGGVPPEAAGALAGASARIPVVLVSPIAHSSLPVTRLDPLKARVLMHLLLAAGRDRESVIAAFAAAERPGPAQL
jgi:L-asparaginase